jgi:hypothetical protein
MLDKFGRAAAVSVHPCHRPLMVRPGHRILTSHGLLMAVSRPSSSVLFFTQSTRGSPQHPDEYFHAVPEQCRLFFVGFGCV